MHLLPPKRPSTGLPCSHAFRPRPKAPCAGTRGPLRYRASGLLQEALPEVMRPEEAGSEKAKARDVSLALPRPQARPRAPDPASRPDSCAACISLFFTVCPRGRPSIAREACSEPARPEGARRGGRRRQEAPWPGAAKPPNPNKQKRVARGRSRLAFTTPIYGLCVAPRRSVGVRPLLTLSPPHRGECSCLWVHCHRRGEPSCRAMHRPSSSSASAKHGVAPHASPAETRQTPAFFALFLAARTPTPTPARPIALSRPPAPPSPFKRFFGAICPKPLREKYEIWRKNQGKTRDSADAYKLRRDQ